MGRAIKMKKILYLNTKFDFFYQKLYKNLNSSKDLDITFYFTKSMEQSYTYNSNEIEKYLINFSKKNNLKIIYDKNNFSLFFYLFKNNFDIVIGGNWLSMKDILHLIYIFLLSFFKKYRWILLTGDRWKTYLNWELKIIHFFLKFIIWRPNKFICCSELHKDFLKKYFRIKENKIKIILTSNNDLNFFKSKRIDKTLKSFFTKEKNSINIGFIGRADLKYKNINFLEKSFLKIKSKKKISLFIIGKNINKDKKNGVYYHKGQNCFQIKEVYKNLDIFVLPSKEIKRTLEAWGIVINEAYQMGLPVIVSDKVGAKIIVKEGVNGFIFNSLSEKDLISKLEILINNKRLREKMRKENINYYKNNLDIDDISKEFEKFLIKI